MSSLWSTGSPAARPIRTRSSGVAPPAVRVSNPSWITAAHSRPLATSSNDAMIPSPVCFTSRPRAATSARRMIRSCSVSKTSQAGCPTSLRSAVEPCRSVNRIVRKALETWARSTGSWILPRNRRTASSETVMISLAINPCDSRWTACMSPGVGALARQNVASLSASNQYDRNCTPNFADDPRSRT